VTKQLMIYENIQALNKETHRQWAIKAGSYEYARELATVPLLATEIPFAGAEHAVIFSAPNKDGEHTPLAVLGVEENENLMLSEDGQYQAAYVPGFIRRYPFVFAGDEEQKTWTLCVDENSKALIKDGSEGRRLFDDNGEQTDYLKDIMKFLQDYQTRAEVTRTFCKKLADLGLLVPMQATIESQGNQAANTNMKGFFAIKREKLKELTDEQALDLFKRDGLELIYAHLHSMSNLNRLIERKNARIKQQKTAANA